MESNGAIAVTVSGGTGTLSYAWDNGAGMVRNPSGLSAGTYTVTVTDANNCTYGEAVEVTEPAPLGPLSLESTGASCNGLADGSIAITITGGAGTLQVTAGITASVG